MKDARKIMEFLDRELSERDKGTLANALNVAAERFDKDAEVFEQQKAASQKMLDENPDAHPIFHPSACDQLIEQFKRQAKDTRELRDQLLVEYADDEEAA